MIKKDKLKTTSTNQSKIWNKEYSNPKLVSNNIEPQAFALRFFRYLRKKKMKWQDMRVLDLGTGNGRNAIHLARLGANVVGIDVSDVAIGFAKKNIAGEDLIIDFRVTNMGERYDFVDDQFNVIIDATSSNSLNETEREVYLSEVYRVLASGGYFFVRALCKDGDDNAKKLIKMYPGKEKDTYIIPNVGLVERVFTREDFLATYSRFQIETITKTTSYSRIGNQSYKRNFWIAVLRK